MDRRGEAEEVSSGVPFLFVSRPPSVYTLPASGDNDGGGGWCGRSEVCSELWPVEAPSLTDTTTVLSLCAFNQILYRSCRQ